MIIEGAISVKAAIQNKKRKVNCVYLDVDKKTKDFHYIEILCKKENIEVIKQKREKLEELASGKSFGGVLADVSKRINDEFVKGDIFYLDGMEDPFNLGYAFRTLYAFGIYNVLLPQRDTSKMEAQLLKSSAGAYDRLQVCYTSSPETIISNCKKEGYAIYGLYRGEEAKDIFDTKFKDKAIFLLGGEKRGISNSLLEMCDTYLYISYGSDFKNALNACGALDVCATLLYNQRRKHD